MKLLRYLVYAVVLALVIDQIVNYTALRSGFLGTRRVAPYQPPLFNEEQRTSLMQIDAAAQTGDSPSGTVPFDAELGWAPRPGQRDAAGNYDAQGARTDGSPLLPSKTPGRLRVLALGDDFTHGDSCADDETWPFLLEQRRAGALEIANLGVEDYGIDQALLRARQQLPRLQPDEVWLGWRPGTTLRITTLYPAALHHRRATLAFKPRFVLDGAALRLCSNPARAPAEYMRLCTDQRAFLSALGGDDLWVARTPLAWAPFGSSWQHHFALTRLLITREEDGQRDPEPWLADRSTPVAKLLQALVRAMADDARSAQARFRLIVLPDRGDLRWRQRTGLQGYWSDAVVQLVDAGVDVLDVSPALEAVGATDQPGLWLDDGHYSRALNAAIAEYIDLRLSRGASPR